MTTMNPVAVTFERILVPTDFSEVSQRALEYAKTFAKHGSAELLLAHVTPPMNLITPPETAWIDETEIETMQQEQLEQSSAALVSEGYRARAISLTGALYDELLSAIKQYKVDLIVLGTHGRKGVDRFLLGSDAEAMIRRAHCPVLSVGPAVPELKNKQWKVREVICATTFDPRSAEVAAFAQKLAAQFGAELVLFHVKRTGTQEDVDWVSFEEAFRYYVPEDHGKASWLRTRLASTPPGSSIVDLAKQRGSDLIVMGAHPGSSITTHLPPGTAAKVLMEAPCPVFTLLGS
jgi:nucleotide-binding universal stress UspA family protein